MILTRLHRLSIQIALYDFLHTTNEQSESFKHLMRASAVKKRIKNLNNI